MQNMRPSSYKVYKRGTVIFVDFGINVDNELSGNHFAIVVNNKDNYRNGVLTVVPISSKNKNCYVPVGQIISEQSLTHFENRLSELTLYVTNFVIFFVKSGNTPYPELPDPLKELYKKNSSISLKDSEAFINSKKNKFNNAQALFDELIADLGKYTKVYKSYKKYSVDSFAMPLNIQSISKKRIKRINKFDPSGEIKAPEAVMAKLDASLLSSYTYISK